MAETDEGLFERYRAGDLEAFRELVERYRNDLLRFLYRLTGSQHAAEDVFQETFLQVHHSAASFDTSRRFKPWLFTIAANKGRDFLRKKGRRPASELDAPIASDGQGATFVDLMEVDVPAPDAGLEREELERLVQDAVQRLTPTLREILLLAYFQRLSYAQIADDLQIPLGTVKSRLHAAVASFARHWQAVLRERGHPDAQPPQDHRPDAPRPGASRAGSQRPRAGSDRP
ncbi:MAG: DNA-directed RNA polymerase sigma-70 factor [Phycisphaerales bacterium]|nr:MAG: DNA-directed RNA polymerase sigma-70 factor [Phycisphaerales bacterium]